VTLIKVLERLRIQKKTGKNCAQSVQNVLAYHPRKDSVNISPRSDTEILQLKAKFHDTSNINVNITLFNTSLPRKGWSIRKVQGEFSHVSNYMSREVKQLPKDKAS
jgi:hypothetical protein